MLLPGPYVYFDRPPALKTANEQMVDELQSKVLPKADGLYWNNDTTSHMTTTYEDRPMDVVSIKRATPAPPPKNAQPVCHSISDGQSDNAPPHSTLELTRHQTNSTTEHDFLAPKAADNSDIYVLNHFVPHIETEFSARQISHWYRQTAAHVTAEPSNHTPETSIRGAENAWTVTVTQSVNVNEAQSEKEKRRDRETKDEHVTLMRNWPTINATYNLLVTGG